MTNGLHRTYYSGIERGVRNVSLVNIERIAKGLKTSLADAALLYDNLPVSNLTTLLPPLQSIVDAANAKNARNFANGMRELTDGCNACHRSLGRGRSRPTGRRTSAISGSRQTGSNDGTS